ncbi:MAG: dnaB, partial [Jatrophihabitantaceae bacterium]|nr:dnaB [Jatrophihabitantaceae bacterium]
MAVADDTGVRAPSDGGGGFDRTPPQDIAAEQSVLGGMLLSKDAIADVVEVLRPGDFYRPSHQLVYDAILDLYGRGEPADPVTVSAELNRLGVMSRVGGASYIHTLISQVPTAANAGYYAQIVAEQAILRRLVQAGTRIVQMGYGAAGQDGVGTVDEIVDRAQAEVYEVTERRTSEDYIRIEDLLQDTMDEIDRISSNGGIGTGIPTGFTELDQITNGLHPGQMITVAGRPGAGKALALDTPLPTPTGWTTMGQVAVGDLLIGADGRPTRVVAATDVMVGRPCYEVEFSDGTVIVADAEHQWLTSTRASRRQAPPKARLRWSDRVKCDVIAALDATDGAATATVSELARAVPRELAAAVQSAAWKVGSVGREARQVGGSQRSYVWRSPVYSAHLVLGNVALAVGLDGAIAPTRARTSIVTTAEMAATVRLATADGRLNHAVDCAAPLELPEADLLVPPYTLGAWLGDGTSADARITSVDAGIVNAIRADGIEVRQTGPMLFQMSLPSVVVDSQECVVCGVEFTPKAPGVRTCGQSCGGKARFTSAPVAPATCQYCAGPRTSLGLSCESCKFVYGSVKARLRTLGVLGNKHIPAVYQRASIAQRRALLAGLLDTDGYAAPTGAAEFGVVSRRLALDVYELVVGLGYRAQIRTKTVAGRSLDTSTAYTVSFTPSDVVFRLERKAVRQRTATRAGTRSRYVVAVRPIESVPVRCVEVDNVDHMYLASESMIPTHNSTLGMDFARSAAVKHGKPTVFFSLEMSKLEIMMRLFSAESRIPLRNMRSGHMTDEDWTRMARRSGELAEAPLFIDDSPNLTMMEIRAKARRLKQRHDLQLIVIDYLQLMTSGKRVESRQQEVCEFSRSIKLLAKEL